MMRANPRRGGAAGWAFQVDHALCGDNRLELDAIGGFGTYGA